MIFRVIMSLPTGSSAESLTQAQREKIDAIDGQWTKGGMPCTTPAGGRYLIDALTRARVTREMLDALGLPLWLIVGCWSWDGVSPAVVTVEPLDTVLYLPHLPDPELLREPHQWAGWPPCIQEESNP